MSNGWQHQALEVIRYGDLGASVYPSGVPARVADELVTQYRTFRATIDCFLLWDGVQPTGVCILEEPHHLLVFHAWWSDTLEILNKGIEIEPAAVSHACKALFRALPAVREIRVEVPFQARELDLPTIVGGETEYMIAELPATFDEYLSSLGTSTRRNLRLYENRLSRAFPGFTSDTLVRGDAIPETADLFLGWKNVRFEKHGRSTYWQTDPHKYPNFVELVHRCGEARVVTIEGEVAAVVFAFWVGNEVCALQSAFDPRYEKYHLGLLMHAWLAREAVARGAARLNIGVGSADYKERVLEPSLSTRRKSPSTVLTSHASAASGKLPRSSREGNACWRATNMRSTSPIRGARPSCAACAGRRSRRSRAEADRRRLARRFTLPDSWPLEGALRVRAVAALSRSLRWAALVPTP